MSKKFLFLFLFFASFSFAQSNLDSLTLSEVMFYQPQANCEFIELFNYSKNQYVNIKGLKIKYHNSNVDSTKIINGDSLLSPQNFLIILEGDYDFENRFYVIPDSVPVLTITDNNFGSSGMSNSSDKTIRLLNAFNDTLSVYTYSADNRKGYSDEKIFPWLNSNRNNWENSLMEFGTPGIRNSVTPFNFDLKIKNAEISRNFITVIDTFPISAIIENIGLNANESGHLALFIDYNRDSNFTENEFYSEAPLPMLAFGDTVLISNEILIPDTGNYDILAVINYNEDENNSNDSAIVNVNISARIANYGEICINELKYLPLEGEPEWIEIYNNSDTTFFNLREWKISDRSTTKKITENNLVISPHNYLVIAKDDGILDFYPGVEQIIYCNFPSLNNSGDLIKLEDNYGNIIDSVEYFSSWNNSTENASLEKIISIDTGSDSTNWGGSHNPYSGTPGIINSLSPKQYDLKLTGISYEPNNALINEQINLKCKIKNQSSNFMQFAARLFNDEDNDSIPETLIDEIYSQLQSNDSISLVFNTNILLNNEKYFLVKIISGNDQDTTNNKKEIRIYPSYPPKSLKINEVLYSPQNGECEWAEFANDCSLTLNLKYWVISDILRTPHETIISSSDYFLEPNEKLIIAKDSSILDFHNYNIGKLIVLDFPNLNNSQDGIYIKDANGNIVDSLFYKETWTKSSNNSLERILLSQPTNDSTNWSLSTDIEHSTPWRKNSVSPFRNDLKIKQLTIDTTNISADFIPIKIKIGNIGIENSNTALLEFYNDINADSTISPDEFLFSQRIGEIFSSDSLTITRQIQNPDSEINLILFLNYEADENIVNNYSFLDILPNYSNDVIKINEIHYAPANGEPEWIEFENCSNEEINLKNFLISDVISYPHYTKISDTLFIFPAKSKLVLAKDSSIFDYHSEIPSIVSVKKFANLNNDTEGITIKNAYKITLDSLLFNSNWSNSNGCSLERISVFYPSQDSLNWGSSKDDELSTPGRKNSLTQKNHNLRIDTISFLPKFPTYNENVSLSAKLFNKGTETESNFKVFLFENSLKTDSLTVENISPNDSLTLTFTTKHTVNDSLLVKIYIDLETDEDLNDNYAVVKIFSGVETGKFIITEFTAYPDSSGEWIEILNNSSITLDASMLFAADSSLHYSACRIDDEQMLINPGQYFVICKDSVAFDNNYGNNIFRKEVNFGSLNNSRDIIYLLDFRGNLIDSVSYNNWNFEKGSSFEKIDLDEENIYENWHISIDSLHCTPGKLNSVNHLPEYQYNDLVINEILYEPDVNNSEFFEIYNKSNFPIQIGGFKFTENSGKEFYVTKEKYLIPPDEYFVVAADSNFLTYYNYKMNNYSLLMKDISLSNENDCILLMDFHGNVIDSVCYTKQWHNTNFYRTNNRSLERINPNSQSNNPSNWSSSVSKQKATPGKINSIYQISGNNFSDFTISPNPFSPDNDGFEDVTFIRFRLKNNINLIRITIFDDKGRKIRIIEDNLPAEANGEIIFDGKDENGIPLPLGIYVLLFEEISNGTSVNKIIKPLVIARKL